MRFECRVLEVVEFAALMIFLPPLSLALSREGRGDVLFVCIDCLKISTEKTADSFPHY